MDKALYDAIVDLLLPDMRDHQARQVFVEAALRNCAVLNTIKWPLSDALTFTRDLVSTVWNYGQCIEGEAALVTLLEEWKKTKGHDRQTEAYDLIARLKQIGTALVWQPQMMVDRYVLVDRLGTGGNGQVWLAEEPLPDGTARQLAIKVLLDHVRKDSVRVQRFLREISVMARIDHAHIVPVYTYDAQRLYVVMPLLRGGTLRSRLKGRPIAEAQALEWLEQVGAALDYVHDRHQGIIHRDVKPENMLFDDEGRLCLSDFGLVFSNDEEEPLSKDGRLVGTGRYMAPEQWHRQPLSRQTDLYALGILAYELLTGHLPFQQRNDLDLGNAHCDDPLPPDAQLADEVLRILRKACAKVPSERYESARAFLGDLRNWREDPANIEPRIRDYLDWAIDDIRDKVLERFVELAGDESSLRSLPEPKRRRKHYSDDDIFERTATQIYADHVAEPGKEKVFVENVRARLMTIERVVLIGEPGSGKSFMLQRLTVDYAQGWLEDPTARIPVLVYLNEYEGGPFTELVKQVLDTLAPYHDQLLRDGRLVLLCDALNEMPRGAGQVDSLVAYLQNVTHYVISCRVRDYDGDELKELKVRGLEQVLLRDLELPAIRELVHKRLPEALGVRLWAEMGGTDALFSLWQKVNDKGEAPRFWEAKRGAPAYTNFAEGQAWRLMHSGVRLIPLARNPFMGDLLCRTYKDGEGELPKSRGELFGKFIAQMLAREATVAQRRGEAFPETDVIEKALVRLAQALQAAKRTIISRADAMQAAGAEAEELLRAALDANILSTQGEDLKFAHQLLQEYFAAKILLEQMEADEAEGGHTRAAQIFGAVWWNPGVWRETAVILGEFLGEGARGANRVARWLAPVTPEFALEVITRTSIGLTLDNAELETIEMVIAGGLEKIQPAVEPNPIGRAAAGRALGLVGDPRPGVGTHVREDGVKLPDIEWVHIPAGDFSYQDGTKRLDYDFWIARYPITYAQFQTFLDDPKGYGEADRWFAGLAADEDDRKVRDQYFKFRNHPREMVTWYQAMAFCRWLSWRMGGGFDLKNIDEWAVRLPTELEWEKAARAQTGWDYPWGPQYLEGHANIDELYANAGPSFLRQSSAVGIYPQGDARHWEKPISDLSGNVWEWCLTAYENPLDSAADESLSSNSARVLRGGSWNYDQGLARAVSRYDVSPGYRLSYDGFRMILVRP